MDSLTILDVHNFGLSLKIKGRHDPCIAIRAVPVVESMTAITLVDLLLRSDL